jgi:murein DD-endopeptidase / murein LD-carboxypeptidase
VRGYKNVAGLTTRQLLYVSCLTIIVLVAANVRQRSHTENPQLHEKILAFKKEGAEKKISPSDYDVDAVITFAESLVGTPHKMGGYSSAALDCSGLVKLAHAHMGIALPHSSQEQARYGTIISQRDELKRGDLVFFHSTYVTSRLVTHSGIYLGENRFIHTSTSRGVTISALMDSAYWQDHYLFATRLSE